MFIFFTFILTNRDIYWFNQDNIFDYIDALVNIESVYRS